MKTVRQRRPIYQIHLSSLLVQMFLFAFVLYLQFEPVRQNDVWTDFDEIRETELLGWPEIHTMRYTVPHASEERYIGPLIRDMACMLGMLVAVLFLQEAYLRRPKPLLTWGRGIVAVLLLAFVLFNAWRATREYCTEEFLEVHISDGMASGYMVMDAVTPGTDVCYHIWSDKYWIHAEEWPALEASVRDVNSTFNRKICVQAGERKRIRNPWARPRS